MSSDAPPYSKLENDAFSHTSEDVYDPPPAYNEAPMPLKDHPEASPYAEPHPPPPVGFPVAAYPPPHGSYPPPHGSYPPPQGSYPPPQGSYPMQQQQFAPAPQMMVLPQAAPVVTNVVIGGALPPGTCTVCRKGKIKDSASCCTWLWCLLLLPLGILPGLIAFCCCCRGPKCTHCGFTI